MDPHACAQLAFRTSFKSYITLLRDATDNDFSLVSSCRLNVCGALWGTGNPDVSGVGMATGYLMEVFLCCLIVATSLLLDRTSSKNISLGRLMVSNAARAYYDTASFFTFAIQIACIITLAKADWGLGADGVGGITKEITWLVSMMSLLPLMVLVLRPRVFGETASVEHSSESACSSEAGIAMLETGKRQEGHTSTDDLAPLVTARRDQRIVFFVVCWALAFCSFYSRMGGTFGESQIGNSSKAVITQAEWSVIEGTCFSGVSVLDTSQKNLITAMGIISYLLVTSVVLQKIIASVTEDLVKSRWAWANCMDTTFDENSVPALVAWLIVGLMTGLSLVVQFWAFFRLRRVQSGMVEAAGGTYPDGQWSFGQIVAIAVFLPVFTEVAFVWRKRSLYLAPARIPVARDA